MLMLFLILSLLLLNRVYLGISLEGEGILTGFLKIK